ncbi:MAG: uracil-DNA glycosylase [Saprospiraceae bacterium]|nr:uracil-DNA glycosylase [Saprospiraceae bacterium]MBK7794977.1 uracil-DNA glycosylase [Saprospiraceae bacterium]
MVVRIESSWKELLGPEFEKEYFRELIRFLRDAKTKGKVIYPPGKWIFRAFDSVPVESVRVVILGQDPYHGPGEAMGYCFSVPRGIKIPPSLNNIYAELNQEFGYPKPDHGDLSEWAKQGVLLLNASLTVEHKEANSHKSIGWHAFTDAVIQKLSEQPNHIIFMLWGNFARSKKELINSSKHLILESAHPSPLAGGKFMGNRHFILANEYLRKNNLPEINWQIF